MAPSLLVRRINEMKHFKAVLFLFYYIALAVFAPGELKAENEKINEEVLNGNS